MQPFPHRYAVSAAGEPAGEVSVAGTALQALRSASPAEFDGPGDRWSPETFLTGALADCFVLTFRAVARASQLSWISLRCEAVGTVDRVERVTQFTAFDVHAHLIVPEGTDVGRAQRALEKTEHNCLVASSLKAAVRLLPDVQIAHDVVTV